MSQFAAAPRETHMGYVIWIFAYLATNHRYRIVFDHRPRTWSQHNIIPVDWHEHYPYATELLPSNMPKPLGAPATINFWCDAAFATTLDTRRSHGGIIIFVDNLPIVWYSKQLKATETSAFGAEFTTLKIACKLVVALRYRLRMLGIPITGPANGFVDNQAVVTNCTIPTSTLTKRHNSIAYHYVRELMAANIIRLRYEPGKDNIADILTKGVDGTTHARLIPRILH